MGNDGDDTLRGGEGNDILNGGNGNDTADYTDAAAGVTVNLSRTTSQNTVGAGTDTLSSLENVTGSAFNDTLTGSSAANIMVGGAGEAYTRPDKSWRAERASPAMLGGKNTQALCVQIDNVDAHAARAKAAGAVIFSEPQNSDYGEEYWEDRSYGALDLEGRGEGTGLHRAPSKRRPRPAIRAGQRHL